jgi:hypothetical protein
MKEDTQVLIALEQGAPHAASRLLPLIYGELRKSCCLFRQGEPRAGKLFGRFVEFGTSRSTRE